MIEAFTEEYRGQFAQVYAAKGISLSDLIEAGKEVLREETGEIAIALSDIYQINAQNRT